MHRRSPHLTDVEPEPQLLVEPDKPTARQLKNLNRLVGTLRDGAHLDREPVVGGCEHARRSTSRR